MLRGLAEFEREKNERSDFYILTKYGKRTLEHRKFWLFNKFNELKILITMTALKPLLVAG